MKINFTGRHFTVTPAIKKHSKEQLQKIEKILESKEIASAHFIFSVEKYRHKAELLISWRDQSLSSVATTDDMYSAILQSVAKMERQALKVKDKVNPKQRQGRGKNQEKELEEKESLEKSIRIIRSRRYAIKPMSPEEAAYDLKGIEDQFLVFRDIETDSIGVIYKRKDGNYGLIEP